MANYANGAKLEYAVRDLYLAHGWYVVRSAGSHGAVDLTAWFVCDTGHVAVHLIQCKRERTKKKYDDDVRKLRVVPAGKGWKKFLFVKRKGVLYVHEITKTGDLVCEAFTAKMLRVFVVEGMHGD